MNREIVVSIINYRTPEMTIESAQSVLEQFEGVNGEVVIVDNLSGDNSIDVLEGWLSTLPNDAPIRLIRSPANLGFSGGHNLGMAAVIANYYLILNSDALLRPGFIDRILLEARAHPEAGFIAPRLEGDDGSVQNSCFRFPSPIGEFIRGANTGVITKVLNGHYTSMGIDPDPSQIEWASFACILVNAQMYQEIGPMDEGFFLYFEDAEYCLRGRRAGWHVHHCPEARAVHFRGGSGPVKKMLIERKRLPAYFYSSRTRFMYLAYGRFGLWRANILWLFGHTIAVTRKLAGRKNNYLKPGESVDIWTNIWNPMGPRHAPGE